VAKERGRNRDRAGHLWNCVPSPNKGYADKSEKRSLNYRSDNFRQAKAGN